LKNTIKRENVTINDGVLFFDGFNTVELADKYNTPLYVISKNCIKNKCSELKNKFLNKYDNTRVAYAGKAFLNIQMCKIIEDEGFCLDVVSGGELYTAIKAGFPAEKIEFNGNNKTNEELELAIDYGVGRIIVDGTTELSKIESICANKNKTVKILYRITPGVKTHTHDYISTGKKDSKFGIPLDEDVIYKAIKEAISSQYVEFLGFHFHIGSQLFDNHSHLAALETSLKLIKETKARYDYSISELNLGGGFGICYTDEIVKPYSYFLDPLMKRIQEFSDEIGLKRPAVVIEPGRSIIGEAGITLYRVGAIKEIKNIRKYIAVDGGMTDNIRPALYDAKYDAVIANRATEDNTEVVTVCGKCCETGDVLIKDIKLATPKEGDILAVFSTGAYCYTMASNYNRNPIPAVVLLDNGISSIMVKRQSYDDMISLDVI